MATTIRLARVGRKKLPQYRIVVTDSRNRRDGRFVESLGWYNPLENPAKFEIDGERLLHYVNVGASVSDTVATLCESKGLQVKRNG